MSTPEQARAALRTISQLAQTHGKALSRAFQLLGGGALQGPAATALHSGLAQRQRSVQQAFVSAYDEANRIASKPSKDLPVPKLSAMHFIPRPNPPAAAPPLPFLAGAGITRSGKPDELQTLAREVSRAGRGWQEAGSQVARLLSGLGLPATHGRTIGTSGEWVAGRKREINERHAQLTKPISPDFGKTGSERGASSSFTPPVDTSRPRAANLAKKLGEINDGDTEGAAEVHAIAVELNKNAGDPEFNAAFWASLKPWWRSGIPEFLYQSGSKTAAADLRTFSQSLNSAVRSQSPPPEFNAVKQYFLAVPRSASVAWNKLALLKDANFPADFTAQVVARNALTPYLANPAENRQGGLNIGPKLGLPSDNLSLAMHVMKDGTTLRQAFSQAPGGPRQQVIRDLMKYAQDKMDPEMGDQFGKLLADASGTSKPPGERSPEEVTFALDTIVAMSGLGNNIPKTSQDSMTSIALAYKNEIVNGSRFDTAEHRQSSMSVPENWTYLPGDTKPLFILAPKDTYNFFKTFAGNQTQTTRFDTATGKYRHDRLLDAAKLDANAVRAGKSDPRNFQDISAMLGSTAQLQYKALARIGGDLDAADARLQAIITEPIKLGTDLIPGPEDKLAEYSWTLTKYAAGKNIDSLKLGGGREAEIEDKHALVVRAARHEMASILIEAKFPNNPANSKHFTSPPESISSKGALKPFTQIVKEKKLTEFDNWCDQTGIKPGTHTGVKNSFDGKIEHSAQLAFNELALKAVDDWEAE